MRNPKNSKANRQEENVQRGRRYIKKSGAVVSPKIFTAQTNCKCKNRCSDKISVSRQQDIFNKYYGLMNWSQKTLYLRALVKRHKTKENLNPILSLHKKNAMSNEYFFIDEFGNYHAVCRKFILKCSQITQSRISRAINSSISNEVGSDHRGHLPKRVTNAADIDFLTTFIERFPVYESHYSSKTTNKP